VPGRERPMFIITPPAPASRVTRNTAAHVRTESSRPRQSPRPIALEHRAPVFFQRRLAPAGFWTLLFWRVLFGGLHHNRSFFLVP